MTLETAPASDLGDLRQKLARTAGKPDRAPWPRAGLASVVRRLWGKTPSWVRRHKRYPCCIIALLTIRQKDLALDGLVTEVSRGGLLFRPASQYIFDRTGADVLISFADDELWGRIVNVKSAGYGIAFDDTIEEERVQSILERFGIEPSALA
jgi:hypothetical protein